MDGPQQHYAERNQHKREHAVQCYLNEVLEQAKLIYDDRNQNIGCLQVEGGDRQKSSENLMYSVLIIIIINNTFFFFFFKGENGGEAGDVVTLVYASVKMHRILH